MSSEKDIKEWMDSRTKRLANITLIIGIVISIFSLVIGIEAFLICLLMAFINTFIITYSVKFLILRMFKKNNYFNKKTIE